jgi:DNA mismatch endonuclease (patch repair protein)
VMTDIFSRRKRSEIMSRVKGSGNKATELRLIQIFKSSGIRGWRRRSKVFGKPDFVFYPARLAVFVDGCFWHGCPTHGTVPTTNKSFWQNKIAQNQMRDRTVRKVLTKSNWHVLRIWQHELRAPQKVAKRVRRALMLPS